MRVVAGQLHFRRRALKGGISQVCYLAAQTQWTGLLKAKRSFSKEGKAMPGRDYLPCPVRNL